LEKLVDCWLANYPQILSYGLALLIRSLATVVKPFQQTQVELVWSGPEIPFPLRRTDQALLELIHSARQRLILISFAVYKAQAIIDAIEVVLRRNVEVIICLKDVEESRGKVTFSGSMAFANNIFRLASFYYWPIENRPQIARSKYGSLHAKVVVADRKRAFISSANLTEYAMDLNIELGAYIQDVKLAEQIDGLFDDLIIQGVFKRVALQA
jgi:cardiolipin synthase